MAGDRWTPEYIQTINEEFDRLTELLNTITKAGGSAIWDSFQDIIMLSNYRLQLAEMQMACKKDETERQHLLNFTRRN